MAFPSADTIYIVTITDSVGCYMQTDCEIFVNPSFIQAISGFNELSGVFPNPISESSILKFANSLSRELQISIYNSIGKNVTRLNATQNELQVNDFAKVPGEYFYRISFEEETISTGRFTKN